MTDQATLLSIAGEYRDRRDDRSTDFRADTDGADARSASGADGARRHRQHHAAAARRAMARQHHHARHHARPAGADAARCRDHGGDAHAPPARRRAGHRLGHHHRGHRPREHAGRARPGAQRARRHRRQQPVPRRLPELPHPRHRRQPRAADGRRHAHARLPRFQPGRRHLHARAARPRGHQARRDHPRPRFGALRLRRDRRRGRLHDQGSRRLHDRRQERLCQHQGRLLRRQPAVRRDRHRRGQAGQRRVPGHLHPPRRPRILSGAVLARAQSDELLQQRLPGQAGAAADRRRHHPHHRRLHPGPAEHADPVGRRQLLEPVRPHLRRMGPGLHPDLPHQRPVGARRADRLRRPHRLHGLLQLGLHPGRHVPAARRVQRRHPDQRRAPRSSTTRRTWRVRSCR